ncbi:hypothetical protein D3C81_786780 [compost metagenome]
MAVHRSPCGAHRRGQQRARARALATLEITIAGADRQLARRDQIAVHGDAHRATRLPPFGASGTHDLVNAFGLGIALDDLRTRHHQHAYTRRDATTAQHLRHLAHVTQAAIGAGADEHHVHRRAGQCMAGLELHVVQALLRGGVVGGRDRHVNRNRGARMRAPGQGGADVSRIDMHINVEACTIVADQRLPVGDGLVEVRTLRPAWCPGNPVKRRLVRCDHPGACTGFDGHVAQGHALFHVHRTDCRTAVFDDMAGAAVDADHADDVQHHVLGADAGRQLAIDGDGHGPGLALQQALRGQHVADFAGADAERQRTERAVRGGVAVAADDGHARLGEALLRCDDMHDAATGRGHVEQLDAVLGAVLRQHVDLRFGGLAGIGELAVGACRRGRRGVIHRRLGAVGTTRLQAALAQFGEGLRRGDFVDQVQVDVQHGGCAVGFGDDDVRVPQFVVQGFGCGAHCLFRCLCVAALKR